MQEVFIGSFCLKTTKIVVLVCKLLNLPGKIISILTIFAAKSFFIYQEQYLFGYDQKVDFDYSTYVKHECFGTYFAFISIPDIAIAKIEENNPQVADQLYKYVRNMGTYYLDNIDIAYGNLKSGEKSVAKTKEVITSNEILFKKWMEKQVKSNGEPYSKHTINDSLVCRCVAGATRLHLILI